MRLAAMRLTGFLLLLAGWVIDLAAVALLKPGTAQAVFVVAGTGVQILGLVLAARSHLIPREDKD